MQKLLFITAFLFAFQLSYSQESEINRNYILGGSISYSNQTNGNSYNLFSNLVGNPIVINNLNLVKSYSVITNLYFGKMINKHWTLGINTNLSYLNNQYELTIISDNVISTRLRTNSSRQISGGIFARYVFNPDQKVNFFVESSINYSNIFQTSILDNDETTKVNSKINSLQCSIPVGIFYNINDRFRVMLRTSAINYTYGYYAQAESEPKSFNNFNASINLSSFAVGFEILL